LSLRLLQRPAVSFKRADARRGVRHHRGGIGGSTQLGHPPSDVLHFGIEFYGLDFRIEEAEIGGGVASAAGGPLPVAVVGGEVIVEQLLRKIAFAPEPVVQEVLAEKAGGDHAHAVVHKAGGVEFTHTGIDDGIAGPPFAPALKLFRFLAPGNGGVLGLEGLIDDVGEAGEDRHEEFPPDQLTQPGPVEFTAGAHQLSD